MPRIYCTCSYLPKYGDTFCSQCGRDLRHYPDTPSLKEPVRWVVVKIGDDRNEQITAALERQGIEYVSVSWEQTVMWDDSDSWSDKAPYRDWDRVFVWGPVTAVRDMCKRRSWLHWMPLDKLKCTDFYHAFYPNLVQREYVMQSARDLLNHWDTICGWLGHKGDLFVRPNGNNKRFTGDVFNKEEYEKLLEGLENYVLVVAATPYKIDREWRVLMVEGEPITGSIYKPREERAEDIPCPGLLRRWWHKAKETWDGMPSMINFDIAQMGDEFALLEVSSVNCAGFYEMDYDDVVLAITNQAEIEYKANDEWRKHADQD